MTSSTSISSATGTARLTGSTKPSVAGKNDVDQLVPPTVARTRTEPKPRRCPARAFTSSVRSSGIVTKCHVPPWCCHNGAEKRTSTWSPAADVERPAAVLVSLADPPAVGGTHHHVAVPEPAEQHLPLVGDDHRVEADRP